MFIERMPFCSTSAVLGGFGEHGEPSLVTVAEIKRLIKNTQYYTFDEDENITNRPKLCIFAISTNPRNVRTLQNAGFKIVDSYEGIQGKVRILTFHVEHVEEGIAFTESRRCFEKTLSALA